MSTSAQAPSSPSPAFAPRGLSPEAPGNCRGDSSGALIPTGGLAALECSVARRVPAGDHLLVISEVTAVAYVAEDGAPLIRFRGSYPVL